LRVAHLLVRGEADGIGLHVADLAHAQQSEGGVDPLVLTAPSREYAQRLATAGVRVVNARGVRFARALSHYARLDLAEWGVDLVHLHGFRASHLFPALRLVRPRVWGLPAVATCHGFGQGSPRRTVRTWLELRSYAQVRALITSSEEQAARARAVHPGLPVTYVPNGVSLGATDRAAAQRAVRERFGFPPEAEVVAVIGRLAPEKRVDLFVEACARIRHSRPRAHFLVVGAGRERQALERLVRQRRLTSRLRFAGQVDDVPAICAGMTLLLHCADTEGTPRAVLHAMAAGTPVVATAVGGIPQLITDRAEGMLVASGDAEALARRAVSLLADSRERREMGRRARERVESDFTIGLMRHRVEETYRRALMPSGASMTRAGSGGR
jgi:glycosyltransferase involved in cell wall biosynthesis